MSEAPGTVSRILWHFTGGPVWNERRQRQSKNPKPPDEAYAALVAILRSNVLRVGNYKEVVKVLFPRLRRYDTRLKRVVIDTNVMKELISAPICSVADIPIAHLPYHARRYGKFAIGFHRDAAMRHGFNPVFYTTTGTGVLRSLYEGFAQLGQVDLSDVQEAAADVAAAVATAQCRYGHATDVNIDDALRQIEFEVDDVERYTDTAKDGYKDFLAFVKTFELGEFAEIYTEREWRATESFRFASQDIAMIVLPRTDRTREYFSRLLSDTTDIALPRSIPIVPWEDLLEY